jgi:ATP-dependent helicase HrpB
MVIPSPLPIDPILPNLIAALRGASSVVLRAPTGAGKTTRVPPALLDAGVAPTGRIIMLEPRRLAARAAARRISAERGGRLGDEIGYHVRFDRQCGPRTRILVVTPGILLRMLLDDPLLETVGAVIFDEFHERGLESDLALGMTRLIQQTVRPELRIVVMSATLAVERIAKYLGDCPIIAGEGRQHPVEIQYNPRSSEHRWPTAAARAVEGLLERTPGGVLVFLPGMAEIRQTAKELEPFAQSRDVAIFPLHGDLPAEQQDAALLSTERRKVVLATNVAETSVTVEGIIGVVDTGLARVLQFDPSIGLDRLTLVPISKSSADQRAGRAGRAQPGICIRLWSEISHRSRPDEIEPEIRRLDLAGAVLQLLAMGESDIARFPWLEPPREATIERANLLLRRLAAIGDRGITDLGRTLARLPVHPRLGRLLLKGHRAGVTEQVALAAAILSERDPFARSSEAPAVATHTTESDLLDRIESLEEFEQRGHDPSGTLNQSAARFILRARDQLVRAVRQELRSANPQSEIRNPQSTDAVLRSLLAAFPDRLARRREPGSRRGVMVGGRGVRLAPASGVTEAELFVCVDVDASDTESLVRQASAVRRDWIPSEKLTSATEVEFDSSQEKVIARRRVRYEDLLIEESPAALPDDAQVASVLITAALQHLDRILPDAESPAGLYLTRLRCLREWMPEQQLPAFDESDLEEMLTWLAPGCRSFADLRKADWLPALQGRLSHLQRQAVERDAPERIEVPSGSRIAIRYEVGRPPVLAVRIQELFGLTDTPRLGGGRVPVLLHLLAPNYRPQQVTDDLASFWHNTYQQVRKELRARYPRHAWPEDPWTASAERRPKRRSDS